MIARANGHRGTKRLTTAIADDPQWTRSELERRMRKLARDHGFPQPLSNHTLDAPDHPGLEATSTSRPTASSWRPTAGTTTSTRQAFENDRAKDAALTAAGYTVMRFTWRQLRDDPQHRRRAHQSGMLPCLRFGPGSRLVSSVSSAVMSFGRVSWGTMTSSM